MDSYVELYEACKKNNLEKFEYICNNTNINQLFINLCINGQIEIIEYILECHNTYIKTIDELTYYLACKGACNGTHYNTVLFLLKYSTKYNITYNNDIQYSFVSICKHCFCYDTRNIELLKHIITYCELHNDKIKSKIYLQVIRIHKNNRECHVVSPILKYLMYLDKHNYDICIYPAYINYNEEIVTHKQISKIIDKFIFKNNLMFDYSYTNYNNLDRNYILFVE